MKVALYNSYGSFPTDLDEMFDGSRTDEELIAYLDDNPNECITIVEIPDNVTDWDIRDYDGIESICYVVDGKLHYAHSD